MSRKKEQITVEACDCECDCPADVLEAGSNGKDVQAVADLAAGKMAAATSRANGALTGATDAINKASERAARRLDDARERLAKQDRGNVVEWLGIGAALAAAANQAQDRQSKMAGTVKDARNRASDRVQDVAGSAADALQNVTGAASDKLGDVAGMAADKFGDLRDMAADRIVDLGKALPHKRKPSLWERLAMAGMMASLLKQFESGKDALGDTMSSATKKAKNPSKFMKMGGPRLGAMLGKRKAEKQAKQGLGWLRRRAQPKRSVSPVAWGLALGVGAGLMYFMDPEMGNRRRALVRDQFIHLRHSLMDRFSGASQEMQDRTQGMVAEAHRYTRDEEPSDRVLAERVHAQLGFLVSHPGSIDVTASNGMVTLRGPVLAAEVEPLLTRVRLIPGVTGVENRLDVHQQAGDVPGLQGGMTRENL